jgi:hypothetical protein
MQAQAQTSTRSSSARSSTGVIGAKTETLSQRGRGGEAPMFNGHNGHVTATQPATERLCAHGMRMAAAGGSACTDGAVRCAAVMAGASARRLRSGGKARAEALGRSTRERSLEGHRLHGSVRHSVAAR